MVKDNQYDYEKLFAEKEKILEKKRKAENRIKMIEKKIKEGKRKADTKRKIEKGGTFEVFEKNLTDSFEITTKEDVSEFFNFVFSDERNRNKLREITNSRKQKIASEVSEKDQVLRKNN